MVTAINVPCEFLMDWSKARSTEGGEGLPVVGHIASYGLCKGREFSIGLKILNVEIVIEFEIQFRSRSLSEPRLCW